MGQIRCDCCHAPLALDNCFAVPAAELTSPPGNRRLEEWLHVLPGRVSRIVCEEDHRRAIETVTKQPYDEVPAAWRELAYRAAQQRAQAHLDATRPLPPLRERGETAAAASPPAAGDTSRRDFLQASLAGCLGALVAGRATADEREERLRARRQARLAKAVECPPTDIIEVRQRAPGLIGIEQTLNQGWAAFYLRDYQLMHAKWNAVVDETTRHFRDSGCAISPQQVAHILHRTRRPHSSFADAWHQLTQQLPQLSRLDGNALLQFGQAWYGRGVQLALFGRFADARDAFEIATKSGYTFPENVGMRSYWVNQTPEHWVSRLTQIVDILAPMYKGTISDAAGAPIYHVYGSPTDHWAKRVLDNPSIVRSCYADTQRYYTGLPLALLEGMNLVLAEPNFKHFLDLNTLLHNNAGPPDYGFIHGHSTLVASPSGHSDLLALLRFSSHELWGHQYQHRLALLPCPLDEGSAEGASLLYSTTYSSAREAFLNRLRFVLSSGPVAWIDTQRPFVSAGRDTGLLYASAAIFDAFLLARGNPAKSVSGPDCRRQLVARILEDPHVLMVQDAIADIYSVPRGASSDDETTERKYAPSITLWNECFYRPDWAAKLADQVSRAYGWR